MPIKVQYLEYLDFPLLSLEETLRPLYVSVPSLKITLSQARQLCNKASEFINPDESAAIYLYTMQTTFFEQLNKALREENRDALKTLVLFSSIIYNSSKKITIN